MKDTDNKHQEILERTFKILEGTMNRWEPLDFEKIDKIHKITNGKFETDFLKTIYSIIVAEYAILPDRSMEKLTSKVLVHFKDQIDKETATKILLVIIFGTEEVSGDDLITKQIRINHGLDKDVPTGNEIENSSGKFGYSIDNPIPVQGIDKINDYFAKLKLITGETVTQKRVGSFSSDKVTFPVDKYEVFDTENKLIAELFIYANHGKTSEKVPEGFLPTSKI